MKKLMKHLCTLCLSSCIILGTVFTAAPRSAHAASWTYTPPANGKVYNVIRHFLSHVVNRDPYSFYSTIPCTAELRECIGYLLDAWQTQGVDLISRFNLHWSASYPYANVRNFCSMLDKQLSSGSTVSVPCGNSTFTFLFQKYKNADAAFAAGAFNAAGTIGLLTSPTEQYGHCWISLGAFPYMSEYEMRIWLENYYGLGRDTLSGTLATGDANKVWRGYGSRNVWRVHATRWSEGVHGGCAVDNGASGEALKNALCYVLIPVSDSAGQAAPPSQPSAPSTPSQPAQPTQPAAPPPPPQGYLSVQLSSSLPELTAGNPNYALSGVKIGVYSDAACTRQLVSVPTDANGSVTIRCYASQTVYVKPASALPAYEKPEVQSVKITEDETSKLSFVLTPKLMSAKISVQPQVSAPSLEGVEFTVRYYACTDVKSLSDTAPAAAWTVTADRRGAVFGEDTAVPVRAPEGSGGFYRDPDGRIVFPFGIITVEQTGAAEGQSLGGTWAVCGSSAGSGLPVSAASAQEGSNAPVICFTADDLSLQSLVSDGTVSYLVSVLPAGTAAEGMQLCIAPSEKTGTGLWFAADTAGTAEQLVVPITECGLFSAGGNAKPDGSPLEAGDIVRLYGRSGEPCFEGSVSLYGSAVLHLSDLVRMHGRASGDRFLPGLFSEAADGSFGLPNLFRLRSQVLGTAPIAQTVP